MIWPSQNMSIIGVICSFFLLCTVITTDAATVGKSRAECQNNAFYACLNACSCTRANYKKYSEILGRDVVWSEMTMKCRSVESVRQFDEARTCLVFDPEVGTEPHGQIRNWRRDEWPDEIVDMIEEIDLKQKSDEGVPLENRAYNILRLWIIDDNVKEIKTNCEDDSKRKIKCLSNKLKGTLEHVTSLYMISKKLRKFGRVENPVMQLFPNLRELVFQFKYVNEAMRGKKKIDITMIELYYLKRLSFISPDARIRLHCAFRGDGCLTNPKGLKFLRLSLSDETAAFEIYGKWQLPRIIEEVEGDVVQVLGRSTVPEVSTEIANVNAVNEDEDGGDVTEEAPIKLEPEEKQTEIFKDITFTKLSLDYELFRKGILSLADFKQPTVINVFSIYFFPTDINTAMPQLLDLEIEDKLKIVVRGVVHQYEFPFIDIMRKEFDNKRFGPCTYGKALLSKRSVEKTKKNKEDLVVIRGYHMTLSQIEKLAKGSRKYKSAKEIHAFVYSIDIDKEMDDLVPETKRLKIFFVEMGTSGEVTPGIRKITCSKPEVSTEDFPVEFIHLRNCKDPDPVMMRALATCLMMNIGEFDKASPSTLMNNNEELSKWYTIIKQTRKFSRESYTNVDIARTESAFKFLSEYIIQRENQITKVSKVPFVSLNVLTQNIHILSEAGRDLRDKARHFETLDSFDQLSTKIGDSLQASLNAIADSKIAIMESAKAKSISLGDIELRKQKDLNDTIDSSGELIKHLEVKFTNYSDLVMTETETFKSGVQFAMGLAIAEAAAEAVNSILSIFTGGFNPVRALKAARAAVDMAKLFKKLMTVLKKIGELLKKRKLMSTLMKRVREGFNKRKATLSAFFGRQKSVLSDWLQRKATVLTEMQTEDIKKLQGFADKIKTGLGELENTKDMVANTVTFLKAERTVRMGYDPGNPAESVTVHDDKKLATVQEAVDEFKDRLAKEAADQGNQLSAVDLFKWKIAKEHVTGMLDSTLSDDVPEATSYRTALLKLITTGEMRTQASLDLAAVETKLATSVYAHSLYYQEGVSAEDEIIKTKDDLEKLKRDNADDNRLRKEARRKKNAAELDLQWEILAIKLEMVQLNEEYCNAFYYFHLQKCKEDLRISPSNSLDEILNIQNMLMYESNQKLNELYPPPQTFTDKTITFKKPKHCKCLAKFNAMQVTDGMEKGERDKQLTQVYAQTKTCLINDGFVYPTVQDGEEPRSTEHDATNEAMAKCTDNNYVQNVIDDGEFIYTVDINSDLFDFRERVRVDDVKVVFKGVKTVSGVVEILAESTGVSEDRFKQQCFKFITDKWKRTLSYYSPNAEKVSARGRREITDEDFQAMKQMIEQIKQKVDQQASSSSVTFIDAGDIHKSFSGVFRSPTVFSTWLFKLPRKRNPGLDLTGLTEIQLKFSGSFVSAQDTATPYECAENEEGGFEITEDEGEGEVIEDVTEGVEKKKAKTKSKSSRGKQQKDLSKSKAFNSFKNKGNAASQQSSVNQKQQQKVELSSSQNENAQKSKNKLSNSAQQKQTQSKKVKKLSNDGKGSSNQVHVSGNANHPSTTPYTPTSTPTPTPTTTPTATPTHSKSKQQMKQNKGKKVKKLANQDQTSSSTTTTNNNNQSNNNNNMHYQASLPTPTPTSTPTHPITTTPNNDYQMVIMQARASPYDGGYETTV